MTHSPARSVLVTGAANGIGRAIARRFLADGWQVVGWDKEPSNDLPGVRWHAVDVSEWSQVESAGRELPPLHAAVTSAGIGMRGRIQDLGPGHWRKTLAVNVEGTALTATAALDALSKGRGTLVTIGSIAGVDSFHYRAAYCASKAAVIALTKCLANEWAELGVRTVCVSPGFTRTAMFVQSIESGLTDENIILKHTPQGALLEAEEVADAVVALCKRDFRRLTGANVLIDGGYDTLTGF
jgi:meso-butanediol dehydrogenase / (S,S)-butanediol dehydrogenase / diacetyl reductase